jgi:hypothetical protein
MATPSEIEAYDAVAGKSKAEGQAQKSTALREKILAALAEKPRSGNVLAADLGTNDYMVKLELKALDKAGSIVRVGGRNGVWEVAPGSSRGGSGSHGGRWLGGSPLKGGKPGATHHDDHDLEESPTTPEAEA